jgi:dihydroxy-acid dehydratase
LAFLLKNNLIDGNNMTVTGKTLGENLEGWTSKHGELNFQAQDVIRPLDNPIKQTGHIRYSTNTWRSGNTSAHFAFRILKGNIAPGGAVAKITGKEGLGFVGKARTFDSEDDFVKAVEIGTIKKGEKTVAILRYLGPQGGPGEFFFTICAICPTTTCLIFLVPKHWHLFKFIFVIVVFPPFQDHLSYLLPSYVFL